MAQHDERKQGARTERVPAWVRGNPLLVGAIASGLAMRVVFWVMTDRRIDDALITVKHATNATDGIGLIHHLGEGQVHGFTSALSVLIPIPGELIAADGGGFVLLRLVSLVAFALAVTYAYRTARELRLGTWPTVLILGYLAFDQNQIFFGMAGMETQIAVGVLLAGVYYVLVEDYRKSGVALGMALLARPDFLLWIVPAYAYLLIRDRPRALRAGLISAAIVVPWLIFTTAYYGSPVPHTVTAKSTFFGPTLPGLTDVGGWVGFVGDSLERAAHDWTILAPFTERLLTIDTPAPLAVLKLIALIVVVLAIIGAVATWRRASWRPAITFVAFYVAYKILFLGTGYNDWYGPPAIALIVILAAAGLQRLTAARARFAALPALALVLAYSVHIPFSFPLERSIQHDIEDQVRLPMGRYLADVVDPGQTIGSESAGYVSFYSNGTLYDFPGLTSPTVVEALPGAATLPGIYGIAQVLRPDWLVMRPSELDSLRQADPETARQYSVAREFEVPLEETPQRRWGLEFLNVDRHFIVLRRTDASPPAAG